MTTVNVYVLYVIAQFFGAHYSRLSIGQTVAQENCAYLIKFGEVDIMQAQLTR